MANNERMEKAKQWLQSVSQESATDLGSRLSNVQVKFTSELDGLSEEQSRFKPSSDEWSVREVSLHVSRWMRANSEAVTEMASGQSAADVEEVGSMDDDPGEWNLVEEQVASSFSIAEQSSQSLGGEPNLELTAPHPFFGELNCTQWFAFNLMHLNVHIAQIKRIKDHADYPTA